MPRKRGKGYRNRSKDRRKRMKVIRQKTSTSTEGINPIDVSNEEKVSDKANESVLEEKVCGGVGVQIDPIPNNELLEEIKSPTKTFVRKTFVRQNNMERYFEDQKEKLENKVHVVKANYHQGDMRFLDNAGKQCTCNCLLFLINTMHKDVSSFNSYDLDTILVEGNKHYQIISRRHRVDFPLIKELEGVSKFQNHFYKLTISGEYSGSFTLQETERNIFFSLPTAIQNALTNSAYVFMLIGDNHQLTYCSCIFRNDSGIYVFDPHCRDNNGYPASSGGAVLLHIRTMDKLISYLRNFSMKLNAQSFEMVSVKFEEQTYVQYRQFYLTSKKRISRSTLHKQNTILNTATEMDVLTKNEGNNSLQSDSMKSMKERETEMRRQKRSLLDEDAKKIIRLRESKSRQNQRLELDREIKETIQKKDTKSKTVKRLNMSPENKTLITDRETKLRKDKRMKLDKATKTNIQKIDTQSRNKKRSQLDEETRDSIRRSETQSRNKKRSQLDEETRDSIRRSETQSRNEKRLQLDEETRDSIRRSETQSRNEKRSKLDKETRDSIRRSETQSRNEKRSKLDEETRDLIRRNDTQSRKEKRSEQDPDTSLRINEKETRSRTERRQQMSSQYQASFNKSKKQFPCFVCTCCNRTFYRQNVRLFVLEKYKDLDENLSQTCSNHTLSHDEKEYICSSCHSSLIQKKLPANAVSNNLKLQPIPHELQGLSQLETVLISQRIIFLKLVNLPRGAQKGLIGSLVNVPVDTDLFCSSLPRTPEQAGIIPLKLKRRLHYKGHHLFQNIRPDCVSKALQCLISINKFYRNIPSNVEWVQQCQEENEDIYNSLFEKETEPADDQNNIDSVIEGSDDEQMEANDPQAQVRGLQYDTCMHPNNPVDSGKQEYCIAPGEGKLPLDVFADKRCEALAFPTLFPSGSFTMLGDEDDETNPQRRKVRLTPKKYFVQRITNKDNRFATNIPYLFYALNVCEKNQVQNSITIALRKAYKKDMTVGQLKDPEIIRDILIKDQAFQFLQQVRGSPSFWQHAQYELLAMVRSKGIFTWFLTLSCADLQWPETIQAIALQQGKDLTDEQVSNMSYEDKCNWLRQNPVTAARQFDHRLQSFFKDVILSPANPIGKVTYVFQRTEFQLRGSPHCHAVLWVENAPTLEHSSDEEITEWINKYVTCEIPPEDDPLYVVVKGRQTHIHSVACTKKSPICRFHYPKPPSARTLLSKPPDETDPEALTMPQLVKTILTPVHEVLNSDTDLSEFTVNDVLTAAGVSENDYYKALQYSKSSTTVTLKREPKSKNVNNYNRDLLKIWDANMDLQFVCDPYACISYIVAYVTKDERELSQMLKETAKNYQNTDVKTRLKKIGTTYLNHREVSAQEAAYRLLSIPLKRCSTKMIWIPTDLPEDRIAILKPQAILDSMEDDDTDVYSSNIIKRYSKRPKTPQLEALCLAEFAQWYDRLAKCNTDNDEEDGLETQADSRDVSDLPKKIKLIDSNEAMTRRKSAAVPRYHVFSVNKEPEKYFHQQLLLFFPWRDEKNDLILTEDGISSYEKKYKEVVRIVKSNKQRIERHSDLVDHALDDYNTYGPPQQAWDLLDPAGEQSRTEEEHDIPPQDEEELQDSRVQVAGRPQLLATSNKPHSLADEQLTEIILQLNNKQRQVFQHIVHWCKDMIESYRGGKPPPPFQIFLTGGAGTGKSMLIKAIYHQACKILQQPGDDPSLPIVLSYCSQVQQELQLLI